MAGDKFYKTKEWKELRKAALWRDGGVCVVEGCWEKAVVVDHRVARPRGAPLCEADRVDNLRSLCRRHDNEVKEGADGTRRSQGRFSIDAGGWNADGSPKNRRHPWYEER